MRTSAIIFTAVIIVSFGVAVTNAQWMQQSSGTNTTLSDVVMLDSTSAIVAGRNGSILRTTNSGTMWFDVAAPLSYIQPWSGLSFYDASLGIVVGDHGVVLTTSNGGVNWIWHQTPGGRKCLSALYRAPGDITVGADSGWVYTTSDTGRTWIADKISEWPIRSLFTYRGPVAFGVVKYALTSYSVCTQSNLSTRSWNESLLQGFIGLGSEAIDAEFCNVGGAGFIVGVQGDLRAAPAILRRSLSDSVWRGVAGGIMRDGTFLGVSAPSSSVIYVCGSSGMIYRSANGGETWVDQSRQTRRSINAVFFHDEKTGIAVGDSGLILFTKNGGVTRVDDRDAEMPTGYQLWQNHPNPFNPSTSISFSVPRPSFVSLTVVDCLGREAAVIVSETLPAGTYTRQWTAAGMASGAYYYRLHAGPYTETKKLVIMK